MIEVLDRHAAVKQRKQRRAIGVDRDVEGSHCVAALRWHAIQQRNVAFGTGHQYRFDGLREAKLQQRADPVGVAIEHVETGHGDEPSRSASAAATVAITLGQARSSRPNLCSTPCQCAGERASESGASASQATTSASSSDASGS